MKKNAAIIGYGGMGGWHADFMRQSDVVNLVGVYDIKPERNALAESRGIHAYASLEELLAEVEAERAKAAAEEESGEESEKDIVPESSRELPGETVLTPEEAAEVLRDLFPEE